MRLSRLMTSSMFLCITNKTWKNRSKESCFKVIISSFDGAVICKLVEVYIQCNLETILSKTNFGLYREKGLILLRNLNGQQINKKKKVFKNIGFSTNTQTNLKEEDSLDVTLNLVIVHTRRLMISCFKSTHRRIIHPKSPNS